MPRTCCADGQDGQPRLRAAAGPPSDPLTRGIEIEREEFFAQTPAEGTDKQKREFRQRRFDRAVERPDASKFLQ